MHDQAGQTNVFLVRGASKLAVEAFAEIVKEFKWTKLAVYYQDNTQEIERAKMFKVYLQP
jgi:hypothetical protein